MGNTAISQRSSLARRTKPGGNTTLISAATCSAAISTKSSLAHSTASRIGLIRPLTTAFNFTNVLNSRQFISGDAMNISFKPKPCISGIGGLQPRPTSTNITNNLPLVRQQFQEIRLIRQLSSSPESQSSSLSQNVSEVYSIT